MSLAVVTGASGFVGSHLVDHLLGRGFTVRCLLRETSSTRWLPMKRIEVLRGQLAQASFLEEGLRNAEYVFHVAGATWAPSEEAYMRSNAHGAARLAEAVLVHAPHVRRVLLVSSLAAAGPAEPGRPRVESDPEGPTSPYGRSKLQGEREMTRILGEKLTVVRPPAVLGPRDVDFPKLFRLVKRGLVPQVGRKHQEVTVIHAQDLARGMLQAAQAETAAGQTYFLTHPELTNFETLGRLAAEALGRSFRSLPIPNGALIPFAEALNVLFPLVGRDNPFPPDRVRDLLQPAWSCSPDRAQREFGFEPRISPREGIADSVRWCREAGWL